MNQEEYRKISHECFVDKTFVISIFEMLKTLKQIIFVHHVQKVEFNLMNQQYYL